MYRYDEFCEEIIKYFKEEAIPKNYSDPIIKMDLDKKLYLFTKDLRDWYNESLQDSNASYDDGYEDGKEEGYEDGHRDGFVEGKQEAKEEFIAELAARIIGLKQWLLDTDPNKKDIQIKLTELLIKMDDEDNFNADYKLSDIDSAYNEEN